ncbi:MAG: Tol-Pal system protein TolB [Alphaproteobacteria bacterium]|nr:Tol-Pal system protein TolB [Alphaproteobacteria bacterium]
MFAPILLAVSLFTRSLILVFGLMFGPQLAQAQLRVDITQGHSKPLPIAVLDFASDQTSVTEQNLSRSIAGVIRNNLANTRLFTLTPTETMIKSFLALDRVPNFENWRIIGAQAMVHGRVEQRADGSISVGFRLWDSFREIQMHASEYSANTSAWRRIAHIISDAIYSRLTGEGAYFDSSIVYVAESGPADMRIKRLAIMDQDGANHRFFTDGSATVLTPRFSPTKREITYLSYSSGVPHVYLYDIGTGRREILGNYEGITFAPRFSPDGNSLIFSQSVHGNSEIFIVNLHNRQRRRLTNNNAIDTSPSFSPDGSRVAFNSDRGGKPHLYVMNADGRNPARISFGKGAYTTPVWSPRGDLIAFTKQRGGKFYIGVMRPDGSQERLLSQSYLEEGPTWSPNGRVLMFFREFRDGSGAKLYSVDLTGFNLREVPTPGDASDPAWSPLKPLK